MSATKTRGSMALVSPVWHSLVCGDNVVSNELYQTSLMSALLESVYEGQMTYAELEKHGDFGLGTFNSLDGEMVALNGEFFQLRSDGSAHPVSPDEKTPFAVVTHFHPEKECDIRTMTDKAELLRLIDAETESNLFSAIRLDGLFSAVTTRTVSRQQKPYPPLTEATKGQAENHSDNVRGTLAGFRTPAYAQGIGVAGYHLHFLRQDKQAGGHALDYTLQEGRIQVSSMSALRIELPKTRSFLAADLRPQNLEEQVKSAEG